MEDEDYMPDPDQLTDRVVTPKKRRSRAESTTDAELGEVPQLIKDINLIKKEIDDGNTEGKFQGTLESRFKKKVSPFIVCTP